MTSPAVIGYVRLSRATEESTSVAKQRALLEAYAERHGHALVDIVVDEDVSATKSRLERPGLAEVRRRIAAGDAEAVLVWRLDRVARSVVDFGTLLDDGLHIISTTEPIDTTTPMGRAMAEVLQVFAALEARTIGERVRSSIAYRTGVGRYTGGALQYGYRTAPAPEGGRVLEVDPAEARIVREVAHRVLDGASLYSEAQRLNAAGVKPRKAEAWSVTTVRQMITSDTVLGRVVRNGSPVLDDDGAPVTFWPPVLPLDDVERLRAMFRRSPSAPRKRRAARLLSGLLTCAGCGRALNVKHNASRVFYACPTRSVGKVCPAPVTISAALMEEHLERWLLDTFAPFAEYREERGAPPSVGHAEVAEAIRTTADEMTKPGADVAALAVRLQGLHARREELEAAEPGAEEAVMVATGRTIGEAWEAGDVEARRGLLSGVLQGEPLAIHPSTRRTRGEIDPERLEWPSHLRDEVDEFHPDPAWND